MTPRTQAAPPARRTATAVWAPRRRPSPWGVWGRERVMGVWGAPCSSEIYERQGIGGVAAGARKEPSVVTNVKKDSTNCGRIILFIS